MARQQIKIIGVGNPLMGDDGLGCKTVELLGQIKLPEGINIVDAGCSGLQLLHLFADCDRLILVDAADFAGRPGSFKVLSNLDLEQLTIPCERQGAHQIGLTEVLQTAQQLKQLPPFSLYLMQVKSCQPASQLSAEVEQALPRLLKAICDSL